MKNLNDNLIKNLEDLRNEVDFVYDENYENAKLNNPLRIVAVGDPSKIYDIENVLAEKFSDDVYITRSLPHFCEILNHEADKSYSIECKRCFSFPINEKCKA